MKMHRQARVKRDYCCGSWPAICLMSQYPEIVKEELVKMIKIEIEEYQNLVKQKRGLSLEQQRNKGLL
jgi:hypothetical protein